MTTGRLGDICQEEDPRQAADRGLEPATDLSGSRRQHRIERRRVAFDSTSRRPVIRQHEDLGDVTNAPSTSPCEFSGHADLAVDRAKHRLQIRHDRLDLDDQQ